MDSDETAYVAARTAQLMSRTGLTRRDVLKLGTALSVAAGIARLASPATARAAALEATSPIVKPLPPEWFVNYGTNAEMRWDAVPGRSGEVIATVSLLAAFDRAAGKGS